MFEILESHIGDLSDADLRTLVARLALAELRRQQCPLSAVTAGGNQDAPDGGLDVRVDLQMILTQPDFVPRNQTGFQVKKPDLSAAAIGKEMRPKGKLRPVIADLAAAGGAYIIVSATGSLADGALQARKGAMRAAVADHADGAKLQVDFYDRQRLASWINEYPGVAAWTRDRIGKPLSGWSSIGDWTDTGVAEETRYFAGAAACLVDERSKERETLSVADGIARLRDLLRQPRQCLRLIGLSGLGKTRLVQALFESEIGEAPLDPGIAVYTDYSEETDPTARDMARALVAENRRAVLIVDNCNPATHAELARICSASGSSVSLITVEYDVRDDEPERTEVFRLEPMAPELVAQWLHHVFPDISRVDRERIGEFSAGNFRVARALAETLGKGETLGQLKNRDLFVRIFEQRQGPDQQLLQAAEDLALVYSYDGEDSSAAGELAAIGSIRGLSASQLYAATSALRDRGVVQSRGRWRAILPHAIANPLAAYALKRIPPADFDRFCSELTPRMLKSLSRRLGYLHDSAEAQAAVARWLQPTGPLGDLMALGQAGLDLLANIAPVAPEAILAKLEAEIDGTNGAEILAPGMAQRGQWVGLIKALAYEPHMFETAAMLLARFVAAELEGQNYNSADNAFTELFHLHLSGTLASPVQRRDLVARLARSGDPALIRCAAAALDALLEASHFTSSSTFDFGARPRNWGWTPKINGDVWNWYDEAIALAVEVAPVMPQARATLGRNARDLWHFAACHKSLAAAATALLKVAPWIEGWLNLRTAHKYDSAGMPDAVRKRLERLIERVRPKDLLNQARAVVLDRMSGGWDIVDGEPDDDGDAMRPWNKAAALAEDIGKALAGDPAIRRTFVAEVLVEQNAQRAYPFGLGLAEGAESLSAMWTELTEALRRIAAAERDATVLGGFLARAHERDPAFAGPTLDALMHDANLAPLLPYFQARVGIDGAGIDRLRRAIAEKAVTAFPFHAIANGVIGDAPPEGLARLLADLATLEGGVERGIDILHMYFYRDRKEDRVFHPRLIDCGRSLLPKADFSKKEVLRDHGMKIITRVCLSGAEGREAARAVCRAVRAGLETVHISSRDLQQLLTGLFEVHADIALDEFLLCSPTRRSRSLFERSHALAEPLAVVPVEKLAAWADIDPVERYTLIASCLSLFVERHDEDAGTLSPLFLDLLGRASDKTAFLGDFWERLHPRGWSGSLADVLTRRRARIQPLDQHPEPAVRQWVTDMQPEFERWITSERARDRQREESFE